MNYKYFLQSLFLFSIILFQSVEAQSIKTTDKAVFYNFTVSKCDAPDCRFPYLVQLENVNTVVGSFKGLNERIKPVFEPNDFLVSVFNKKTGLKEWETVVTNPVEINVEYDGHSHQGVNENGSSLQRKTVTLEQGAMSVRLPYEPSECNVTIAYIASPNQIIQLATF